MAVKVGFVSLGCPKNLINTEVMLAKLAAEGFEIVAEDVDADVIVINTCAFIESAKQEAIDNILDVAWLKENHTLRGIVVTGCLPERYREQLLEEMPEVDCILGTGSYGDICEAVRSAYAKKPLARFGDINAAPLGGERVVTTQEHFAYLQIAEGCDNRCSYCVIPSIRGRFRSRPMGEIVEEARELAALGVRELCLVAQDTTRYGEDLYGTYALDALLRELWDEKSKLDAEYAASRREAEDYYAMWAHQIKTPIAAMRLLLQQGEAPDRAAVSAELFRIEQYVEMVLGYLRLDSESTDYVLRDTDLDGLLRQAVRKFARMFILKKITLDFRETGRTVLTDGKWLSFVVEQVLSNALKYTPAGGRIRIYGDGETLVIADSGIGIRPEDLPRVFEKGFNPPASGCTCAAG